MKKYLFIMSLVIASISCSKSEDKAVKEEVPEVISDTFSATIKDGFTGENGEELILHKSLKNILVGDYIPYTLTIKEKVVCSVFFPSCFFSKIKGILNVPGTNGLI